MVSMTLTSRAAPMTRADLDAMPDDGYRHELIDGVLIVTPAPGPEHQDVVLELAVVLRAACPPECKVYVAPFEVSMTDGTITQPDVLVTRRTDVGRRGISTAPLLAVEVLSPSTRHLDLMTKRSRYEEAGAASYWVVDPVDLTLTAWELVDGRYVEVANLSSEETWEAMTPFPVSISPATLRD